MNKNALEFFKWENNPFAFRILADCFVGYEREVNTLLSGITNGDKFTLLTGPTGAGKTTFLKYLIKKLGERGNVIYLPKPPKNPSDWLSVFESIIRPGFPLGMFWKRGSLSLYNLSEKVNRKLDREKCILFVDECHEASLDSLEWLRTITDQVDNLSVVLAGLPVFENILKANLETFMKRFSITIKLNNLTKSETRELVKRRIEATGGEDIRPFTSEAIDFIYSKTGGFPREILKICSELAQKAVEKGISTVDIEFMKESGTAEDEKISVETVEELPERQRLVLQTLAENGELTPSGIIKNMKTGEYKDEDNAVRSINNILRRLMKDGFVERKKVGKTYKYVVSGRFQSVLVKA